MTTSPSTPAAKPDAELMRRAEAWSNARAAVAYAISRRRSDPTVDPDGRIVEMTLDECREAKSAFRTYAATLAAHADAEWVTVPREPTEEMVIAGVIANQERMVADVYRAMLSAAPKGDAGGVGVPVELLKEAAEWVTHKYDCAGFGRADYQCTCGAVAYLNRLAAFHKVGGTDGATTEKLGAVSREVSAPIATPAPARTAEGQVERLREALTEIELLAMDTECNRVLRVETITDVARAALAAHRGG
jgi:hypothetical protein